MRVSGTKGRFTALCGVITAASGLGACGMPSQEVDEPVGNFPVEITRATFPKRQKLAQQTVMNIRVRNAGDKDIENLALTLGDRQGGNFYYTSPQRGLADAQRPIWVVDEQPQGSSTSYVNTWAAGALQPGEEKAFRFRVTAVRPGRYEIRYRIAAGLDGRSRAVAPGGRPPRGSFRIVVENGPPQSRVDPGTGRVIVPAPGGGRPSKVDPPGPESESGISPGLR